LRLFSATETPDGQSMELNPIYTRIKDLQARVDALRGYL
jgi:hypothetical protein